MNGDTQVYYHIGCSDIQADLVDNDTLDLVELELMELLIEYGYDAESTPMIRGSALCAMEGRNSELGEKSIQKLLDAIDRHIQPQTRNVDGPFVLPIESAFTVAGRGTVVIGTLQLGCVTKGADAELLGYGNHLKTAASDIQVSCAIIVLLVRFCLCSLFLFEVCFNRSVNTHASPASNKNFLSHGCIKNAAK
jgi:hypothetical protein